jgi:LPXTG-motif cell wall-anchored protein
MVKTNRIPLPDPSQQADFTNTLRDIQAPISIPNLWLWAGIVAALLLLALAAWWLWKRRRRQPVAPHSEPAIPPHEKAWAALRQALELLDQPRPFCILVSDTVRVYLEERFDLRAPERTTEEFLEELQSSPLLTHEHKRTLGEFLIRCDLVKFARHEPGRDGLQAIYDAAARLVEETQPPPPFPAGGELKVQMQ